MANDERDKQLDEIYYNAQDPGSYGEVTRLLKRALEKGIEGINRKVVQEYLRDQQAYSVHKPAHKHFTRNKTITGEIAKQWQADLADMQTLSRTNSGYKYILTVIDIFSKYAWAIPVKTKSAKGYAPRISIPIKESSTTETKKVTDRRRNGSPEQGCTKFLQGKQNSTFPFVIRSKSGRSRTLQQDTQVSNMELLPSAPAKY